MLRHVEGWGIQFHQVHTGQPKHRLLCHHLLLVLHRGGVNLGEGLLHGLSSRCQAPQQMPSLCPADMEVSLRGRGRSLPCGAATCLAGAGMLRLLLRRTQVPPAEGRPS